MAFNLISNPDQYYPVYNTMLVKVRSDLTNATNQRFVFQIYDRTNNTDNLLSTQRIPVSPDNYGYCDVGKILKNYISYQPNPTITGFLVSPEACLPYRVETGEEISGAYVTAVNNISTNVELTIDGYSTNVLNGKQLAYLILPGLTLSASTIYLKFNSGLYQLFSNSALTAAITATGTFSANGALQTTDSFIPATISTATGTNELLTMNAVKQYADILTWNNANAYKTANSSSLFLTNSPRNKEIEATGYETLSILQAYNANISYAKYKLYDSSGNLITTHNITNTHSVNYSGGNFSNALNSRLDIPTGWQNLLDSGITGATPDHYTVQLYTSLNVVISELFTYTVVNSCNQQYDPMRLVWLNSLGGTDAHTFKMITDNSLSITKQDYRKVLPFIYTSVNRGETVYYSDVVQSWTLSSDYIDTAEAAWLSEVFTSPEVFIINGGVLTPVIVQDKNYTYRIKGKEKLKQINLTIMAANKWLTNV